MNEGQIKLGIGFVTGRANVCNIINKYYDKILKQMDQYSKEVKITIFVLYDMSYQSTVKEEFYKVNSKV